jgi:hypothetical protein
MLKRIDATPISSGIHSTSEFFPESAVVRIDTTGKGKYLIVLRNPASNKPGPN